jgi:hypothetical protein
MIDQNGTPKAILTFAARKSLHTGRAVLELGPAEEVETVRRRFGMFARPPIPAQIDKLCSLV